MYIDCDNTYKLLTEDEVDIMATGTQLDRVLTSKDAPSISNKFLIKPQGILISDSYNNPFFPIRPRPRIDTAKMDLFEIYRRYREVYYQFGVSLLPWHFVIEFINNRYFVFSTRPFDYKFPMTNVEVAADQRKDFWNEDTKQFMTDAIFDISTAIHVLVVGDSNIDIYTKKFYELLGRMCVVPFIRFFKLPEGFGQRIFTLNMGHKFNKNLLIKFVRR